MTHPLVKKAFIYPKRNSRKSPKGFFFDENVGLWSNGKNYLIDSEDKNKISMVTKKADRETGEDQKGT